MNERRLETKRRKEKLERGEVMSGDEIEEGERTKGKKEKKGKRGKKSKGDNDDSNDGVGLDSVDGNKKGKRKMGREKGRRKTMLDIPDCEAFDKDYSDGGEEGMLSHSEYNQFVIFTCFKVSVTPIV